jgi:hypothetical protein
MTPAQERALLDATAEGLDDDLRKAFDQLMAKIRAGTEPRDAVQQVMETFTGQFSETMATALSGIIADSVGTAAVMQMEVGTVSLSRKLYAQAEQTAGIVQGIADRHAKGFGDVRKLALELFEGYGFRDEEVLNLKPGNSALPKYLREELLRFPELADDIGELLGRVRSLADEVKTPALRQSYLDLIDAMEKGVGDEVLAKKLRVAFYEKMRYFAQRIAQTESHRAFAERQAFELMDDTDVEYVQWRMSPTHPRADICDYFANLDRYGLGRGVYIKGQAPVAPAHPFCRCVLSPRLDLTGKKPKPRDGAERAVFAAYSEREAAQIAGSRAKLAQVQAGADPMAVHNATVDPAYRVRTVEQIVKEPGRARV